MFSGLILIVPSVRKGNGSGHLVRSIALAQAYPERFRLYIDRGVSSIDKEALDHTIDVQRFNLPPELLVSREEVLKSSWRYILLDQRQTDDSLLAWLKELAPVAGRDEYHTGGFRFDYLIQSLPVLKQGEINLFWEDPVLIPAHKKEKLPGKTSHRRVLISFGGEDPAGLTRPTVQALMSLVESEEGDLTVVCADSVLKNELPEGVSCLFKPENLKEKLADYDLLVCSYGLTALEAVYAGVSVVTVNPSRYHSRLAGLLGIPVSGTGKVKRKRLIRLVKTYEISRARKMERVLPSEGIHPAELMPRRPVCPVCGESRGRVVSRIPARTFFKCTHCSLIYQQPWVPDNTLYNRDYFFDDYSRQYGRSYLEDFSHIKDMGKARLKIIDKILDCKINQKTLLDIGCAYGPFLAAAEEAGFSCFGVEPAADAAAWVEVNLHISVFNGGLEDFLAENSGRQFDVISLWYVIEHFQNLSNILPALMAMLKPGGILAFATPNADGITRRTRKKVFFADSPGDHYSLWSPSSAAKILKNLGFGKIYFRATGIHRQRFPGWLCLFWPVSQYFAKKMYLGDTFEAYAVKPDNKAGM